MGKEKEEEEEEEEEERSVFMVNFPLSFIPFDRTDTRIAGSRYLISGSEKQSTLSKAVDLTSMSRPSPKGKYSS